MHIKKNIISECEQFEDTKVINRSRKSKKDSQHDGQKGQSMTYNSLHRKLTIEQHEPQCKPGMNSAQVGSSCSTKYVLRKIK